MVAVAEAPKDWRVEAIKMWAETHSLEEIVSQHSEEDLLKYVYGVRSESGAIKKFCAAAQIDNPAEVRTERVAAADRPLSPKKSIHQIEDPEELVVVLEERGIKLAACPNCYTVITPAGKCECSDNTPGLAKKLGYMEPKTKKPGM